MMAGKLTENQRKILTYLKTQPEGARPVWISEGCGHFYEASWASSILKRMVDMGLVHKMSPGWYQITEAGKAK